MSPEAAGEDEYLDWAQSAGAYVDAAGNVHWPDQPGHPDNRQGTDRLDRWREREARNG